MELITEWKDAHTRVFKSQCEGRAVDMNMILEHIAAYENTGYTPEEIAALKADNERLKVEREAAINDILDAAITPCTYCKSNPTNGGNCDCRNEHHDMFSCWQWRGLEESTCGK